MKRVVVIDDSLIVRESISAALEDAGVEVIALEEPSRDIFAGSTPPDLVLMDVNLPQIYGDDAAELLQEVWGVTAPMYLFSDLDEEELAARSRAGRISGYICKGWGMERVVSTVCALLREPTAVADE